MKMTDTMPTTGQFAMIHDFAGLPWGSTYKWEEDVLMAYAEETDTWEVVENFEMETSALNIHGYFVVEAA